MINPVIRIILVSIALLITANLSAQDTEIQYLSGKGVDDAVDWGFYCTGGMQSGKWATIPVPSCWEQHGFGKYNYGHAKDSVRGKEKGLYKYTFKVPSEWKKKEVSIVFEGSMTDTEVKINGHLAGPVHQGAFYRFKYDISKLLKFGKNNLLEVTVSKHSANESVNKAERYADFWIFGGVFRPVYLEAKPKINIKRVAINAKADGVFNAEVFVNNSAKADSVRVQVAALTGDKAGSAFISKKIDKAGVFILNSIIKNIKTWNPEYPNLYNAKFSLYSKGEVVHEFSERFGFRTIEVRPRDGIYVNGVKIKLKGVNRHTFTPEHGRASSKRLSIRDVQTMKAMNMNAMRCSHYPPDSHFLDVCDSLGLFVLNELAGWHNAYDDNVGKKLVREMVTRDVNHPSVIMWDNGNEGGHNPEFDPVFSEYDIQNRVVIHPWKEHNGFATQHYRSYDYGVGTFLHGHKIVMPTEFLHGLYDGGSGAGLYGYWEQMWETSISAGGFLWVFADEGIARYDKNRKLDTYGQKAPDGILGPNHEKEGSYYTIKKVWSPVFIHNRELTPFFDGVFKIENRYLYTNLKECSFSWKLTKLPLPGNESGNKEKTGGADSPDIAPGYTGSLKLRLPSDWQGYDILYVSAFNRFNQELYTWSWPISLPGDVVGSLLGNIKTDKAVTYEETEVGFLVKAGEVSFTIGKNDGILKKVKNKKGVIPFNNGPVLCAGEEVFKSIKPIMDEDTLYLLCSFDEKESRVKEFTWSFFPSGWAKLNIYYVPEKYDVHFDYMGVNFSYPEKLVKGVKWFGRGPYRVWKNRMQGVELGLHQKGYNNTITGEPPLVYPEFKGYHANLYWAEIESKEQSFIIATSTEDVFFRLYTPGSHKTPEARVLPPFPGGDISFMQAIPPIGTKTNDPWNMGPSGKKNMFFDYGPYGHWRGRSKVMELYFDFR